MDDGPFFFCPYMGKTFVLLLSLMEWTFRHVSGSHSSSLMLYFLGPDVYEHHGREIVHDTRCSIKDVDRYAKSERIVCCVV